MGSKSSSRKRKSSCVPPWGPVCTQAERNPGTCRHIRQRHTEPNQALLPSGVHRQPRAEGQSRKWLRGPPALLYRWENEDLAEGTVWLKVELAGTQGSPSAPNVLGCPKLLVCPSGQYLDGWAQVGLRKLGGSAGPNLRWTHA